MLFKSAVLIEVAGAHAFTRTQRNEAANAQLSSSRPAPAVATGNGAASLDAAPVANGDHAGSEGATTLRAAHCWRG